MKTKTKTPQLKSILFKINKMSLLIKGPDLLNICNLITKFFKDSEQSCGSRYAANELKAIYNEFVRYSMDGCISTPLTQKWYSRNNKGVIKILNEIAIKLSNTDIKGKRMILSLLRSYEALEFPVIPDLTPITNVGGGLEGYKTIREEYKKFLNISKHALLVRESFDYHLAKEKEKYKDGPRYHYTTKKGIHKSALATAGLSSLAFKGKVPNLAIKLGTHFGLNMVKDIIWNQDFYAKRKEDFIKPSTMKDYKLLTSTHVKVVCIPDKGTKNRLIAIGNYWIQNGLLPLHNVEFEVLRNIPTDGTHNQESQFNRVMEATKVSPVWSFDLTGATDRTPITIQADTLDHASKGLGQTWQDLMQNLEATYEGKKIVYGTGQPMGLYSSWATFTLTHHSIVQFSAYRAGVIQYGEVFSKYAIIGDDVAIWDEQVALRYKEIINILDVQINLVKSYVPEDPTKGPWKAEFAKRVCLSGIEYSGISPGIVKQCIKHYSGLPELMTYLVLHNFSDLPCTLTVSHFATVLGLKPKQATKLYWTFHICSLLGAPSFEGGTVDDSEKVLRVTRAKLFTYRYNLLMENQVLNLMAPLGPTGKDRGELARLFNSDEITNSLVVSRIYSTLIWDRICLAKRLRKETGITTVNYVNDKVDIGQPISEMDKLTTIDVANPDIVNDITLKNLKALEYIPILTYPDIIKGFTQHDNKRMYKIRFIQSLVNKLYNAQ